MGADEKKVRAGRGVVVVNADMKARVKAKTETQDVDDAKESVVSTE